MCIRDRFYVLSNRSGVNGAACLLYEDVLKNFADGVEKNLIILPSSIHEVLLLPDDGDISYEAVSYTHLDVYKRQLLLLQWTLHLPADSFV